MLLFLAGVIEQLDLALEHVLKEDVHNARFGLMLTDNAIELILHQIAKDEFSRIKSAWFLSQEYESPKALDKALGKSFEDKLKFARIEDKISDEILHTTRIMHEYRNEVYHVGIQHADILPALAIFYFQNACEFIGKYRPFGLGWSSSQVMPERAKKYFFGDRFIPGRAEDFSNGCRTLAKACNHDARHTIEMLSDNLDRIIEQQDTCIDIVAEGVYIGQKKTRDHAIIETQAWNLAFSEEGKLFLAKQNWTGSIRDSIEFIASTYPFNFRADPIPSWQRQAQRIRHQKNPHAALRHYHSLMTETISLRAVIEESAAAAEAEIDRLIDEGRGN